jgi:hypothetical protein
MALVIRQSEAIYEALRYVRARYYTALHTEAPPAHGTRFRDAYDSWYLRGEDPYDDGYSWHDAMTVTF